MNAKIEWIVGICRGGSQFEVHGDPYEFSCTVVRHGDTAEIKGAAGKMSVSSYRAMRREFASQGIKEVIWDRASGKSVKVDLTNETI